MERKTWRRSWRENYTGLRCTEICWGRYGLYCKLFWRTNQYIGQRKYHNNWWSKVHSSRNILTHWWLTDRQRERELGRDDGGRGGGKELLNWLNRSRLNIREEKFEGDPCCLELSSYDNKLWKYVCLTKLSSSDLATSCMVDLVGSQAPFSEVQCAILSFPVPTRGKILFPFILWVISQLLNPWEQCLGEQLFPENRTAPLCARGAMLISWWRHMHMTPRVPSVFEASGKHKLHETVALVFLPSLQATIWLVTHFVCLQPQSVRRKNIACSCGSSSVSFRDSSALGGHLFSCCHDSFLAKTGAVRGWIKSRPSICAFLSPFLGSRTAPTALFRCLMVLRLSHVRGYALYIPMVFDSRKERPTLMQKASKAFFEAGPLLPKGQFVSCRSNPPNSVPRWSIAKTVSFATRSDLVLLSDHCCLILECTMFPWDWPYLGISLVKPPFSMVSAADL